MTVFCKLSIFSGWKEYMTSCRLTLETPGARLAKTSASHISAQPLLSHLCLGWDPGLLAPRSLPPLSLSLPTHRPGLGCGPCGSLCHHGDPCCLYPYPYHPYPCRGCPLAVELPAPPGLGRLPILQNSRPLNHTGQVHETFQDINCSMQEFTGLKNMPYLRQSRSGGRSFPFVPLHLLR